MCGLSFVWYDQNFVNIKWLDTTVNQRLNDQIIQIWFSDVLVNSSSSSQVYKFLKPNFGFEKYINILSLKLTFRSTKILYIKPSFACRVQDTGRRYGTPLNERLCFNLLCYKGVIGDKFLRFSELMSNTNAN